MRTQLEKRQALRALHQRDDALVLQNPSALARHVDSCDLAFRRWQQAVRGTRLLSGRGATPVAATISAGHSAQPCSAFGDGGQARQRWQRAGARIPRCFYSHCPGMREHGRFAFAGEAVIFGDISAMFET